MLNKKCLKGFVHEWETVTETPSHIIKQCERCHGKLYKYRNKDIGIDTNHTAPARV